MGFKTFTYFRIQVVIENIVKVINYIPKLNNYIKNIFKTQNYQKTKHLNIFRGNALQIYFLM